MFMNVCGKHNCAQWDTEKGMGGLKLGGDGGWCMHTHTSTPEVRHIHTGQKSTSAIISQELST